MKLEKLEKLGSRKDFQSLYRTSISLMVFLSFFAPINAQTEYADIVPLVSTMEEVESALNVKGESKWPGKVLMKLPSGNLFLGVSLGPCEDSVWGRWNVEKGVIVDIVFYPFKERKPRHFGLSLEKMEFLGFDNGHKNFGNDDLGLFFSTEFSYVSAIHRYPTLAQRGLRCECDEELKVPDILKIENIR